MIVSSLPYSKAPVGSCIQIVVPAWQQIAMLYKAPYNALPEVDRTLRGTEDVRYAPVALLLAAHATGRASLCFAVQSCRRCWPFDKHLQLLKLLSLLGPSEFVPTNILGALTWTKVGSDSSLS